MHGLPTIGHHRLRLVRRERAQARAFAARHDDGLHQRISRRAFTAYCEQRDERQDEAGPEDPERPRASPWCVTITQPTRRYSSHVAALPIVFTSKS